MEITKTRHSWVIHGLLNENRFMSSSDQITTSHTNTQLLFNEMSYNHGFDVIQTNTNQPDSCQFVIAACMQTNKFYQQTSNNTKENDDHHGGKIFLFEIFKGSDF